MLVSNATQMQHSWGRVGMFLVARTNGKKNLHEFRFHFQEVNDVLASAEDDVTKKLQLGYLSKQQSVNF